MKIKKCVSALLRASAFLWVVDFSGCRVAVDRLLASLCSAGYGKREGIGHTCNFCFPEQEGQAPGRPPFGHPLSPKLPFFRVASILPEERLGGSLLTKFRQVLVQIPALPLERWVTCQPGSSSSVKQRPAVTPHRDFED